MTWSIMILDSSLRIESNLFADKETIMLVQYSYRGVSCFQHEYIMAS